MTFFGAIHVLTKQKSIIHLEVNEEEKKKNCNLLRAQIFPLLTHSMIFFMAKRYGMYQVFFPIFWKKESVNLATFSPQLHILQM